MGVTPEEGRIQGPRYVRKSNSVKLYMFTGRDNANSALMSTKVYRHTTSSCFIVAWVMINSKWKMEGYSQTIHRLVQQFRNGSGRRKNFSPPDDGL